MNYVFLSYFSFHFKHTVRTVGLTGWFRTSIKSSFYSPTDLFMHFGVAVICASMYRTFCVCIWLRSCTCLLLQSLFNSHLSVREAIWGKKKKKSEVGRKQSRSSRVTSTRPVPFRLIYPEQGVCNYCLSEALQVKSSKLERVALLLLNASVLWCLIPVQPCEARSNFVLESAVWIKVY